MKTDASLSGLVKECHTRFHTCLKIPALSYNGRLEELFNAFTWWTEALNAAKSGSCSLDHLLRDNPETREEVEDSLEGLIAALSECERLGLFPCCPRVSLA